MKETFYSVPWQLFITPLLIQFHQRRFFDNQNDLCFIYLQYLYTNQQYHAIHLFYTLSVRHLHQNIHLIIVGIIYTFGMWFVPACCKCKTSNTLTCVISRSHIQKTYLSHTKTHKTEFPGYLPLKSIKIYHNPARSLVCYILAKVHLLLGGLKFRYQRPPLLGLYCYFCCSPKTREASNLTMH